jgi:hypothetical protein
MASSRYAVTAKNENSKLLDPFALIFENDNTARADQ